MKLAGLQVTEVCLDCNLVSQGGVTAGMDTATEQTEVIFTILAYQR